MMVAAAVVGSGTIVCLTFRAAASCWRGVVAPIVVIVALAPVVVSGAVPLVVPVGVAALPVGVFPW
eukprot:m.516070 g.516070  ORF g.516070 m.516070 type:complete len:66 (-) comp121844_c0_seq1:59-256(-)